MFACKMQKFLANGGWHDESAVLNALPPAQQVAGLQCVEYVAPLLLFLGSVIALASPGESVKFLVLIVGGLLLAFPG